MTHINQRRDTAINWTAADPVLHLGEVGWETDTRKAKLGDGSTAWTALPYIVEGEVTSVNGMQGVVVLDKGDIGLGNVDNTPDAGKPVSTAQQAALDLKAPLASPALTGNPTAPTPTVGDNDTSIATTAFVQGELAAAPSGLLEIVEFTAGGSFTKASYPGLRAVRTRVQAGGGAGAGSDATAAGESSAGNGGGGGGYSESFILEDDLAASETVTVGAGGSGVLGGTGNNGGNSSFGTHCTASGGTGGSIVMPSNLIGDVGAWTAGVGAGTGNVIAMTGSPGFGAIRVTGLQIVPGAGGSTPLGHGGRPPVDVTGAAGTAGNGKGSGGSGAISRDAGEGAHTGGAGAVGVVIVEVYG